MKYLDQLRTDPRVESISDERQPGEHRDDSDGIWVYLKPGYDSCDDPSQVLTSIHEWTIKDLRAAMARVTKETQS